VSTKRYDFDRVIDRRGTDSSKWQRYGEDVLPLWVADMDFPSPEPVIDALRQRVDHGVFGYVSEPPELRPMIQERLLKAHDWEVTPEDMVILTGTVLGLNLSCKAMAEGNGVLIQTPIYPPFLAAPQTTARSLELAPLKQAENRYEIDFDAFEESITLRTKLFLLCNPHNPTGRVFTRSELEKLAEICLRHDVIICSDEVHKDFVYPGHKHIPIATLDRDIARRTITLTAPSKSYNIPGVRFSIAIVSDKVLRDRMVAAGAGMGVHSVGILGYVAGLAAYKYGDEWLKQVVDYLRGNRDYAIAFIRERLPAIQVFEPEGTYLAWLDCRNAGIQGNPSDFFLKEAKVALNGGEFFGKEGEGFVRLNFACPRSILREALEKMENALMRRRHAE
jgi:cystathionine beta-lyase